MRRRGRLCSMLRMTNFEMRTVVCSLSAMDFSRMLYVRLTRVGMFVCSCAFCSSIRHSAEGEEVGMGKKYRLFIANFITTRVNFLQKTNVHEQIIQDRDGIMVSLGAMRFKTCLKDTELFHSDSVGADTVSIRPKHFRSQVGRRCSGSRRIGSRLPGESLALLLLLLLTWSLHVVRRHTGLRMRRGAAIHDRRLTMRSGRTLSARVLPHAVVATRVRPKQGRNRHQWFPAACRQQGRGLRCCRRRSHVVPKQCLVG